MKRALAALAILAMPAVAQPPQTPPAAGSPRLVAERDSAITAALEAKDRPLEHKLRDEGRNVRAILAAAWPKDLASDPAYTLKGKRVLDIASGGGYLALLFSSLVGDTGHVDIHNTPGWINQFPSMDPDAQRRWIKRKNIGFITEAWNGIPLAKESYNIVIMGQVYHDVIVEGGNWEALDKEIFDMLKPGGRLIVEDHDAIPEMYLAQQANLHRISHGDVTGHFIRAGFQLEDMKLFDSKYDNEKMNVFFPAVRGRTDRFIATFLKPVS
jgi:predicted methyltransferase